MATNLPSTSDMIIVAFFFLHCLGKYIDSTSTNIAVFSLANIQLFIYHCGLDLHNASNAELLQASLDLITFTQQKNGVKNEVLHIGNKGKLFLCPVFALTDCVLNLE